MYKIAKQDTHWAISKRVLGLFWITPKRLPLSLFYKALNQFQTKEEANRYIEQKQEWDNAGW